MRILNDMHETLLKEERQTLTELQMLLSRFGASEEDLNTLKDSLLQLDEFFLLVVVGEFNAGKSAFINALIGQPLLKEGVTPTTTQVNILRYGEEVSRQVNSANVLEITAPASLLKDLSIVDTPGTNAIVREHEMITSRFVPRADLVLFVTSSDRPFTESERAFLEKIRDWGKKVVVVLNKVDILTTDADLEQIRTFITENARSLLGISPEIFPVSGRLALQAKQGKPQLWPASRFEALESFIHNTLDEKGRLRLKFSSPLGVAYHLVRRYGDIINERLVLLSDDFAMLEDIDRQLEMYRRDMKRDFDYRMSDIENILYEMERRGNEYFTETLRLGRIFDLLNKERIQRDFERHVVSDAPLQIQTRVNEMVDWLVESDLRQWQAVTEHLAERRQEHAGRIVGDVGSFQYDRERLIERVARRSEQVVAQYDRVEEAAQIAGQAQNAVAAMAAMEVGALGLGALITAIATTVAADVTGLLLAGTVAALGLFVIPARRRKAQKELSEKLSAMRVDLATTLRTPFEQEMQRSVQRITDAIAPYTRFVRAEREKLTETQGELSRLGETLARLRTLVEEIR
ncbi:MAG: dynamin family protein [Anaerolineales bacterium]